jgi:hypothetical protein
LPHEAGDRFEVVSAGTDPGKLREAEIIVMREIPDMSETGTFGRASER